MTPEIQTVLTAWRNTTKAVAIAPADQFAGRDKETKVFRQLRQEIEQLTRALQMSGPDCQIRFNRWGIDLVCTGVATRVAIEGKYKIITDGAVPDNRKAAFFDLYKLEQYVASGQYRAGLFLWLTDERAYLQQATGDSADFSTHNGRIYRAGTPLRAIRSRNLMPLPLVLTHDFEFDWESVGGPRGWHSLAICVDDTAA